MLSSPLDPINLTTEALAQGASLPCRHTGSARPACLDAYLAGGDEDFCDPCACRREVERRARKARFDGLMKARSAERAAPR